jgi:hypothetical protein
VKESYKQPNTKEMHMQFFKRVPLSYQWLLDALEIEGEVGEFIILTNCVQVTLRSSSEFPTHCNVTTVEGLSPEYARQLAQWHGVRVR